MCCPENGWEAGISDEDVEGTFFVKYVSFILLQHHQVSESTHSSVAPRASYCKDFVVIKHIIMGHLIADNVGFLSVLRRSLPCRVDLEQRIQNRKMYPSRYYLSTSLSISFKRPCFTFLEVTNLPKARQEFCIKPVPTLNSSKYLCIVEKPILQLPSKPACNLHMIEKPEMFGVKNNSSLRSSQKHKTL